MKILNPYIQKNTMQYFFYIPLIISFAIFLKFIYLIDGHILNHYPFLGSDSFDYIVESMAISQYLTTGNFYELPVLRNPILVLALTVDSFLLNKGVFIAALFSLSFYLQYIFSERILGLFKKNSLFDKTIILYSVFFISLNQQKYYLFSENIAIFFILAGTYYLLRAYIKNSTKDHYYSLLFYFFGAITQFYVLIPYVCTQLYFNYKYVFDIKNFLRNNKKIIFANLIFIIFLLLTVYLWRLIPHQMSPNTFSLLGLIKPDTFKFYAIFWPFYFFVPVLVLFFLKVVRKKRSKNIEIERLLLIIILSHMFLCLHYAWAGDPRFTLIFFYWVLFLLILNSNYLSFNFKCLVLILFFISTFYRPETNDYINFSFGLKAKDDNLSIFMTSEPTNRNLEELKLNKVEQDNFLNKQTPYRRTIFKYYFDNIKNN